MLIASMRPIVLAAALGLTVSATGRAEAGQLVTYTLHGLVGNSCPGNICKAYDLKGSFQVDSDHVADSGNTDISSFITGISFTLTTYLTDPNAPQISPLFSQPGLVVQRT